MESLVLKTTIKIILTDDPLLLPRNAISYTLSWTSRVLFGWPPHVKNLPTVIFKLYLTYLADCMKNSSKTLEKWDLWQMSPALQLVTLVHHLQQRGTCTSSVQFKKWSTCPYYSWVSQTGLPGIHQNKASIFDNYYSVWFLYIKNSVLSSYL